MSWDADSPTTLLRQTRTGDHGTILLPCWSWWARVDAPTPLLGLASMKGGYSLLVQAQSQDIQTRHRSTIFLKPMKCTVKPFYCCLSEATEYVPPLILSSSLTKDISWHSWAPQECNKEKDSPWQAMTPRAFHREQTETQGQSCCEKGLIYLAWNLTERQTGNHVSTSASLSTRYKTNKMEDKNHLIISIIT